MVNNILKHSKLNHSKKSNILFLVAGHNKILYKDTKFHITTLNIRALAAISRSNLLIVCNKKNILNYSADIEEKNLLDILDLFVLLFPTASCSPSLHAIYNYLLEISKIKNKNNTKLLDKLLTTKNVEERQSLELECLLNSYEILINKIISLCEENYEFRDLLSFIALDNWNWIKILSSYITLADNPNNNQIKLWEKIEDQDISDEQNLCKIPEIAIKHVSNEKVIEKLTKITHSLGTPREEQIIYALEVIKQLNMQANLLSKNNHSDLRSVEAQEENKINILLAEAGTGVGKTLGYCAAILAFLEENTMQQVLISTYSKVLQKQVYNVLNQAFANEEMFKKNVVLVKGVNNYICLLNYEYLIANPNVIGASRLFIAIIARWVTLNNSGDLVGHNISPLIYIIFPNKFFNYLLNKREECIYNKCKHFKKCFIMKNRSDIKKSNIIVSNHSMTILFEGFNIKNIIFDEAQHLFNVADEIYSDAISMKSCLTIRHFIHGLSNSRKANNSLNGIKQRLLVLLSRIESKVDEENIAIHEKIDLELQEYLELLLQETEALPTYNSLDNVLKHSPTSVFEDFFHKLYLHILENSTDDNKKYTQEILVSSHIIKGHFKNSIENLKVLLQKWITISVYFLSAIDKKISYLSDEEEKALISFKSSFENVCVLKFNNFLSMLYEIEEPDDLYIYRFLYIKEQTIDIDIAYNKNYINPMFPLATNVFNKLNALVMTSATLEAKLLEDKHEYVKKKFGLNFLDNANISYLNLKSPFDYKNNSKIIITKVPKDTMSFSSVLSKMFTSSNGGGLCLFTSIERLKNVYNCINHLMKESHINLYAQHANNQRIINLLDMFKDDTNSCMLGTDAARDGIDIPGDSLRMVLFEKTPWPKQDILLTIRTKTFGRNFYNDIVIQNLKQAFGRLIRTKTDRGLFIILDSSVPSIFLNHFDQDIEINKLTWENAIDYVNTFFTVSN